jgi:hypothetical protein
MQRMASLAATVIALLSMGFAASRAPFRHGMVCQSLF